MTEVESPLPYGGCGGVDSTSRTSLYQAIIVQLDMVVNNKLTGGFLITGKAKIRYTVLLVPSSS